MIIEQAIEIERPVDQVFEAVTCQHGNVMHPNMYHSRMESNEPIHVGSTFTWKQRFMGQTHSFKIVVTEFERPHLFTIKMINDPSYNSRYTFTPTEQGTLLHRLVELKTLFTPLQRIVDKEVVKAGLKNKLRQENEQLKRQLESYTQTLSPALPNT